jgi:hypothetical protein
MTSAARRRPLLATSIGAVVGAGAAVGPGALVHHWIVASEGPDVGATAATLDEVFGTLIYGVLPALLVVSAGVGIVVHSPPAAFGAALGAAALVFVVAALLGHADLPTAAFLIGVGLIIGALGAGVSAIPIAFRGGRT